MTPEQLKAQFSSATDDWATPQKTFDELHREFGFVLDVCASKENAKCPRYFTKDDDGLQREWFMLADFHKGAVWMNPPYGTAKNPCRPGCQKKACTKRGSHIAEYIPGIKDWVRKAYQEYLFGAPVVCLLPARTDTSWWHDYVIGGKAEVRFIRGRLKFGSAKNSAPFPSAVVIFRPPKPS